MRASLIALTFVVGIVIGAYGDIEHEQKRVSLPTGAWVCIGVAQAVANGEDVRDQSLLDLCNEYYPNMFTPGVWK